MLTNFFKKSKASTFLFIFLMATLFYGYFHFLVKSGSIIENLGGLILFLIAILFINYIPLRDKNRGRACFTAFCFTLLCISSPNVLLDYPQILAGFFIILALKRVIALQTNKHLKQKIFDAFFLIGLAILIYPTALGFLLIPLLGIALYASNDFRNWFILIPALGAIIMLRTCFLLMTAGTFTPILPKFPYEFSHPLSIIDGGIPWFVLVFTFFVLWALTRTYTQREGSNIVQRKKLQFLFLILVISYSVFLFDKSFSLGNKDGGILLYIPIALLLGRYFREEQNKKVREITFLLLCLFCVTTGILSGFIEL